MDCDGFVHGRAYETGAERISNMISENIENLHIRYANGARMATCAVNVDG